MFQTNQMVKARKAIEAMYEGTCTITEQQKTKNADKTTGFKDVVVLEGQPCRLSFKTISQTNPSENGAAAMTQVTKLFIAPEIQVKAGSKITVTQNGVATEYKNSGKPAVYTTHQEIILELWKGWA